MKIKYLICYSTVMETIDISQTEEIFTVSRLNREVRFILEGSFLLIWVEGEISNLATPSSGHWYFSLKDANSQVRCAMFKPHNRKVDFQPKDGMQVLIKARVSLYEGRGEFQLIAEYMEEIGEGQLRLAFEALKKGLQEAGLFEPIHKKPLPTFPKSIGVVTSPTGAAIRDILSILRRRFACVPVIIYPTLVQGDLAKDQIADAIEIANLRKECDVLILARGGGSLEDLWPFNEEKVAHAIFRSEIPIISGVGHEIDFTIADFVADLRAPTPSAAAEIITPDRVELIDTLHRNQERLLRQIQLLFKELKQQMEFATAQLQQQHPKHKMAEQRQTLDLAENTLLRLQTLLIEQKQSELKTLNATLNSLTPSHQIKDARHLLELSYQRIQNIISSKLQEKQQQFAELLAKLDVLSPLATLERGYAIATKNKNILRNANDVKPGDQIHLKLLKGSLECVVVNSNFTEK